MSVSSFGYVVGTDLGGARLLVDETLRANGFDLLPTPAGGFIATSNPTGSGFLGGLFGSDRPHASFVVEILDHAPVDHGTGDEPQALVRWNGSAPSGLIQGKLAGENPATRTFLDTADVLSRAFATAGVLIETIVDSTD